MEEAITAFSAGYEAEPKPQFLLNLAQCYRAIGQRKHAIRYLHRFIAAAPAHALRPAAERTLRRLEQVEREASPKPASASRPAVPGPVLPGASKPAAPVGPRAASRTKWVWIIGLAAAAVAGAIGVGVYFGTRPAQPELGTLRLPP